jgi:hypothetical protein
MEEIANLLQNLTISANLPAVLHSTDQLPIFNPHVPSLQWTPCIITVTSHIPPFFIIQDPYIKSLVMYFLFTDSICSTELCQNISFCHPLWLILSISNHMKLNSFNYPNRYIHPVYPFDLAKHLQQHVPIPSTFQHLQSNNHA